jgi:hypothetical protein
MFSKRKFTRKVRRQIMIAAENLWLWKIEINYNSNGEFSSLVLKNDDTKNITMLRESIGEYWDDEEKRPKEGCTHIIIDSPILSKMIKLKQELARKDQELEEIMEQLGLNDQGR